MATRLGDRRHQELADLLRQGAQLRIAERANIGRTGDPVEYWCVGNLIHVRCGSSLANSRQRPVRGATVRRSIWFRAWRYLAPVARGIMPRGLRLDQAPAGVVALGVARLTVAVEEVQRQTLIGHLQRAISAGDGGEGSADARTTRRSLSTRDSQWRPGAGATAIAIAHARRITVEGVNGVSVGRRDQDCPHGAHALGQYDRRGRRRWCRCWCRCCGW